MKNLKITFYMDGTGVCFYPHEPIHLDGLLAWGLMGHSDLMRGDNVAEIELPLEKWRITGQWGWCASAILPEGSQCESMQFWRKKINFSHIEKTTGTIDAGTGTYREYNSPMPLMLSPKMTAYAKGDKDEIRKILKNIHYLGKKTAYGKGGIIRVEIDESDYDYSVKKGMAAMRYLPCETGTRFGRIRPPYWNTTDRIKTCYVGESYAGSD